MVCMPFGGVAEEGEVRRCRRMLDEVVKALMMEDHALGGMKNEGEDEVNESCWDPGLKGVKAHRGVLMDVGWRSCGQASFWRKTDEPRARVFLLVEEVAVVVERKEERKSFRLNVSVVW